MEKIKLTRNELAGIARVLNSLNGSYSIKMKYAIKKNKDFLKNEVDAIDEASITNSKRFKEYDEKRMKIVDECGEKQNGQFKFLPDGKSVTIRDDKKEYFAKTLSVLQEEYKDGIDERNKELKDFENFLKEQVEIEVFKFSNDIIPDDISQSMYETLFPLIII
jgi:hypothetical protein